MTAVQRIAVVDPIDDSREILRNTLLGIESVWLEAECSRYEFFLDVIDQSTPDVAIVSLDADPEKAVQLITHIIATQSRVDVIATSSRSDGPFILQVMRTGVKEFLSAPVQLEELLGALQRLSGTRAGRDGGVNTPSRIYTFAGARGGVGCTSLAINFGCTLAQNTNQSVALVDLDLAMGDADVCLDIIPDYTLADVALSIDRIDLQLLKRSLSKHSSGLYLLPHPVQIEDTALIHQDHVARVLNLLKMTFTHIIVDCSKGYQAVDFAALSMSDVILLTTQLDVSSLRNVVRLMLTLNERDGMEERVRVIANRVGSNDNEISLQRAEETIGRPIFARVPNDSRTMMAARNNGVPLLEHAPKSKLQQSVVALVEAVTGAGGVGKEESQARSGFFFFGRT